jgi:putative transposase
MKVVEKHIINKKQKEWKTLDHLCFLSKNLYNQSLFLIKQHYEETGKFLRYNQLEKISKKQPKEFDNYNSLPPATSQQILMLLDKNIKSYFSLLKKWKKDKKSLSDCPKFPKYKHKTKGRNIIIIRGDVMRWKENKLLFPKRFNLVDLRTVITQNSKINQIRIVPQTSCYVIEVVYEKQEKERKIGVNKASIDLGINNLCSMTFSNNNQAIIINGKPLKSINQYFNKKKAEWQADLKKRHNKFTSNKLSSFTHKRNNKISDYLHKTSRFIVNCLVKNDISSLVIGYNKEWKQEINIGKRNNQNFVQIPHFKLVSMIKYKCELEGITVIIREESYTSKCSSLDLETIGKQENYLGSRKKRGLFISNEGIMINADINGSLNIGRKEFGDGYFTPTNRGFVMNPLKVSLL